MYQHVSWWQRQTLCDGRVHGRPEGRERCAELVEALVDLSRLEEVRARLATAAEPLQQRGELVVETAGRGCPRGVGRVERHGRRHRALRRGRRCCTRGRRGGRGAEVEGDGGEVALRRLADVLLERGLVGGAALNLGKVKLVSAVGECRCLPIHVFQRLLAAAVASVCVYRGVGEEQCADGVACRSDCQMENLQTGRQPGSRTQHSGGCRGCGRCP